jgi:hypothetical protein
MLPAPPWRARSYHAQVQFLVTLRCPSRTKPLVYVTLGEYGSHKASMIFGALASAFSPLKLPLRVPTQRSYRRKEEPLFPRIRVKTKGTCSLERLLLAPRARRRHLLPFPPQAPLPPRTLRHKRARRQLQKLPQATEKRTPR